MNPVRKRLLLLCLCLAIATPGLAGDADRPRVAVVLGGGAARGLAHVGVLRWLEEERVPVDLVVGTSMGGLIGGAYATGMSADEIAELLRTTDWDLMFRSAAPYELRSYRRKQDARDYPVWLELGLRGGPRLPGGLNPGHYIGEFLSRLALPYSTLEDFDALPVPFRCVATDLETGEQVVLADGPLAQALRATMAIPGVFDPVRRGQALLADGGILNNVPVDVARDLGAEVVIAVKVGSLDQPVSESLLGVADRAISVGMAALQNPRLAAADVLLEPGVSDVGSMAYRDSDAIADQGHAAAAAAGEQLRRWALEPEAWVAHLEHRRARRREVPAVVDFVSIAGLAEREAEVLRRWLEPVADAPLDLDALDTSLDRVIGIGRYASAAYGLVEAGPRTGLAVRVLPKAHAPPFANFRLGISNEGDRLGFDFATRVTLMDVTSYASELRLDAGVGSTVLVGAELFQPLGRMGGFVAPWASYARRSDDVFEEEQLLGVYRRQRSGGGLDVGWLLGARGELRVGAATAYIDNDVRVGDPELPETDGHESQVRARLVLDGLDSGTLPRSGVRLLAEVRSFLDVPDGDGDFGQVEGGLSAFWPIGHADRAFVTADGGLGLGGDPPLLYEFTLGGPFRLGAFDVDEFRGRHYVLGRLGYMRALRRLPDLLGDRLLLAGFAEAGSAFDRASEARLRVSVTAGLVADTFFGPVFFGAAGGNGGFRVYFSVGSLFR